MRSVVLDSSVVVKWFKKGEEFEEEALRLRKDVLESKMRFLVSELLPLEVYRALLKVEYPLEKVDECYSTLKEMVEFGFLVPVSTSTLCDEAVGLMKRLNLYVSDALILAAAIRSSSGVYTEDRHLLKGEVVEVMGEKGLAVHRLGST